MDRDLRLKINKWLIDNAEDYCANWVLLQRHFIDDLEEAGYEIIKKKSRSKKVIE